MTSTTRDQVFISYSHQDRKWLEKLQKHLKPFVRNASLSVWDDTRIKTGSKWKDDISSALAPAKVAVLLVSPEFLSSDFIGERELPPLLEAAEKDGLTIVWFPVSASAYKETEIANYQAARDDKQPLDSLSDGEQNQALVEICETIKRAVQRLDDTSRESAPSAASHDASAYRQTRKTPIGDNRSQLTTRRKVIGLSIVACLLVLICLPFVRRLIAPDDLERWNDLHGQLEQLEDEYRNFQEGRQDGLTNEEYVACAAKWGKLRNQLENEKRPNSTSYAQYVSAAVGFCQWHVDYFELLKELNESDVPDPDLASLPMKSRRKSRHDRGKRRTQ